LLNIHLKIVLKSIIEMCKQTHHITQGRSVELKVHS
jgi:hypothetical protein